MVGWHHSVRDDVGGGPSVREPEGHRHGLGLVREVHGDVCLELLPAHDQVDGSNPDWGPVEASG